MLLLNNIEQMKIKFTLLLFLLLVTFSAIANYNLPKEKLKKVKLQLNNPKIRNYHPIHD